MRTRPRTALWAFVRLEDVLVPTTERMIVIDSLTTMGTSVVHRPCPKCPREDLLSPHMEQ